MFVQFGSVPFTQLILSPRIVCPLWTPAVFETSWPFCVSSK